MRVRTVATEIGCLAALAISILAAGGGTRWSQALVGIVVAVALGILVPSQRQLKRVSPLIALIGAALFLTALQLVPLPSSLLHALSEGATWRDDGAELAKVSPHQGITMDAAESLRALVALAIMLGIAVLALRTAVSERGRYKLIAAVACAIGVATIVTGLHTVFGATSLYGVIETKHHPHALGPLLNMNHLGCLAAIGAVVSIGLAAYSRQPSWTRALWFVNGAACGGLTVYTVSRGATLALVAGAFVTIAILVAQRFTRERTGRVQFTTRSLPIAIVAMCVLVVIVYSTAGSVGQKLEATSFDELHSPTSKFGAWRSSLHIVQDAPWLGIGRGGFESYFTRLHPTSGQLVFSHVENEYLQAVLDWGIVGAIVLALAGAWLVLFVIRRWRDGPLSAAAIGGISVVLVQSTVDFGAEILGIAVPAILLVSTLAYVPLKEAAPADLRRVRALRVAHVIALLVGSVLLRTNVTKTVTEDHETLASLQTRDLAAVESAVLDAIERHPLDYYAYAVAAELAFRRNDANGVRLLNHAMRLNPSHGGLHRIAARRLRRAGHLQQAALEYAVALRFSSSPVALLEEIAKEIPLAQAPMAIPTDFSRPELVVTTLRSMNRNELANEWLARVVTRHPGDARACDLLARRAREHGDGRAAMIVATKCAGTVTDAGARMAIASVLSRDARPAEAIAMFGDIANASGSTDEKYAAWQALCEMHRHQKNLDAAADCLRTLQASPDLSPTLLHTITTLLGLIEEERKGAAKLQ